MNTRNNITTLLVRLIVGGIFITAGWMKIADMPGTIAGFAQMGFGPFLTYFVSYAELIGGALIVLGLWTTWAAGLLSIIMAVAVYSTYPAGSAMYFYPLITLAALLGLLTTGPGNFSFGKRG